MDFEKAWKYAAARLPGDRLHLHERGRGELRHADVHGPQHGGEPLGGIVAIPLRLYGLAVVSGFGVTEPIWPRPPMTAAVGDGTGVSDPRPGG